MPTINRHWIQTITLPKRGVIVWGLFLCLLLALQVPRLTTYWHVNFGYYWLNQAIAKDDGKYRANALALFEQTAASEPKIAVLSWRAMGQIYALAGEEEKAIAIWTAANNHANISDELYGWASASERGGDVQSARQWYERAAKVAPEIADGWYHIGRLSQAAGDNATARFYYEISFNAAQFNAVGASDAALNIGVIIHSQEEWQESQRWFNIALEKSDFRVSDRKWQAHYLRGETYQFMGQPALASLDFQYSLELNPNHYWSALRLAQTIWLVEADMAQAVSLLERAIAISPERKWAYRALGDLYRENGRTEEAIGMYQQVLALDPQDSIAQHYLKEFYNE